MVLHAHKIIQFNMLKLGNNFFKNKFTSSKIIQNFEVYIIANLCKTPEMDAHHCSYGNHFVCRFSLSVCECWLLTGRIEIQSSPTWNTIWQWPNRDFALPTI